MTTRRQGFIGVVAVATLLVCWAGTAGAQAPLPPQRCRADNAPQDFPATGQTTKNRADDDGTSRRAPR